MITIHALRSCSCSPICSLLSFEGRTHVLCEPEVKATWVSCRSAEWRLLFALPSTQSLINSRLIALTFDLTFICYKRAQKHLQETLGNTGRHFKKGWGGVLMNLVWFHIRSLPLSSCLLDDSSGCMFIFARDKNSLRDQTAAGAGPHRNSNVWVHRASLLRSQLDLMLQWILAENSHFWVISVFHLFKLYSNDMTGVLFCSFSSAVKEGSRVSPTVFTQTWSRWLLSPISYHQAPFLCFVFLSRLSQHIFHVCLRTRRRHLFTAV